MKNIKICNRCYETFNSNSLTQYAPCPKCKVGEIVFVDEAEYLEDDYKATLVNYGNPESDRRLELSCTFDKKKDAVEFIIDFENIGLFNNMAVMGYRKAWTVKGTATVKLKEVPLLTEGTEKIIQNYNTHEISDWIKTRFCD